MKLFKTSNRIIASILLVMMLFTVSPVSFASVEQYPAYEFVVTADKTSVQAGDPLTLTITVNGPARYANSLQYNITYSESDFTAKTQAPDAFDGGWYSYIQDGNGFGAIGEPGFSNKNGVIKISYISMSGKYVNSDSTSEIVGKIIFTAVRNIEDIGSCFTLSKAKHSYGADVNKSVNDDETTVIQLSETIAIQKAMNLIDAIGSPVTYSSKAAIEAARSAYNAITPESLKAQVSNIGVLEAAETVLAERTKKIADVKNLIDNLNGESATFKADIEAAQSAYYNDLTDVERATLAGYDAKLQAAWAEYKDRAEAANVDALIEAIKTVTLDSKAAIEAAEAAWGGLTEAQQGYVTKHDTLIQARNDYNTIVSNKQAADGVVAVINAIPSIITRENAETARGAINTARISYNGAGDAIRKFIAADVLKKLTDAEAEIVLVEAAIAEAEAVEKLIGGIGEITLDSVEASDEKLTEIAGKLESISDRARGYIYSEKMAAYTDACNTIAELKGKLARVQAVIDAIAALGDVKNITLEDKEDIEAAEALYDDLQDSELQNKVENSKTLFAIRIKLDALIESKNKVDNVISLIELIGEVKLDAESKAKIDKARGAYDVLTDDEKKNVNNYTTLTDAEALYNELYKAAKQEEKDQTAADSVIKLIGDIGTVELTPKCEAVIIAAENAYNALENDRQRELVGSHYDILTQARSDYDALKADKEAVDAVIKAINDIGTVTYDADCLARIQAAAKAYEDLRDDLKTEVKNSDMITFSKNKYAQLEAEDKAVKNVISLIDAIGDVSWTKDSLDKINAAREAYDDLKRDDLKAKVENADVLTEAEETYAGLKPVFKQEQDVEAYNGNHMTVITNVSENMIVSDGNGVDAVLIKIGENLYHVFVTDHVVEEDNIVLRPGAPTVQEIGNVNGKDGITALDAFMACQYAARTEEAIKAFAQDSLAFVRADVNGSGTITALDALMIANKAANLKDVEFTLLVGAIGNAQ